MPKSTDTSEIYYTIYDDGVWLHCLRCDFNECLGFSATVTDLTAAWSKHKCSVA